MFCMIVTYDCEPNRSSKANTTNCLNTILHVWQHNGAFPCMFGAQANKYTNNIVRQNGNGNCTIFLLLYVCSYCTIHLNCGPCIPLSLTHTFAPSSKYLFALIFHGCPLGELFRQDMTIASLQTFWSWPILVLVVMCRNAVSIAICRQDTLRVPWHQKEEKKLHETSAKLCIYL